MSYLQPSEAIKQQREWARWNSGHKNVWHGVKNKFPGMMGFTLCGKSIPAHAIEFTGVVTSDSVPVCKLCLKSM